MPKHRLAADEAGCKRGDCTRSARCWRYIGALERPPHPRQSWIFVEDTENCDTFWGITWERQREP